MSSTIPGFSLRLGKDLQAHYYAKLCALAGQGISPASQCWAQDFKIACVQGRSIKFFTGHRQRFSLVFQMTIVKQEGYINPVSTNVVSSTKSFLKSPTFSNIILKLNTGDIFGAWVRMLLVFMTENILV